MERRRLASAAPTPPNYNHALKQNLTSKVCPPPGCLQPVNTLTTSKSTPLITIPTSFCSFLSQAPSFSEPPDPNSNSKFSFFLRQILSSESCYRVETPGFSLG